MEEDRNRALQEPLLHEQPEPASTKQTHTFTFANGVTRSVSRCDEAISCTPEWIWREMKKQLYIAGPMVCVALLQNLLNVVSLMFVGHLGELELASSSIAGSFASVTGLTTLIGMASGLETLCGQAYGAKQYHMLGIYTQRTILILYMVALPVAVLWWNMDSLLKFLGQDPDISDLAGVYVRFLVPTLFGMAILQPLVRFLQTQSIVLPMALISSGTLLAHIPLCWALIHTLGFRGAALATSTSTWLNVAFLALYVTFSPTCKKTWTSFSREAFNDLPAFFKLAIPSAGMICLEYWSFHALVLVAGLLPNPKLETSTLSICLTVSNGLYTIPFGVGAAVSTRVGNELGAGRPQAAKGAVSVAAAIGVTEGLVLATILYLGRNVLGIAFTYEHEVIDYVARCIPVLAIMHVMDAVNGILSGVARGCGWQAFGAAANLGAYYVVGLPAAVILAFKFNLEVIGLWLGMVMGLFTQTLTLSIMTCCTNWHQQAEDALLRVYSSATSTLPIEANRAQKDEIPALRSKDGPHEDVF